MLPTPAAARTPGEICDTTRHRERRLSRLLVLYIGTGLAFMLLPGTFLGVWNLISISAREMPQSVPPAWIQAHGHAQIFGWIGSFILGIEERAGVEGQERPLEPPDQPDAVQVVAGGPGTVPGRPAAIGQVAHPESAAQ